MVRVIGLGHGPGNALAVLFLSSSGLISVVNTFVFVGSVVSVSKEYMYATGYFID